MAADAFGNFEKLPPEWLTFLEDRAPEDFFASAAWLRTLAEHGSPRPDGLILLGIRAGDGIPAALLPMRTTAWRRAGVAVKALTSLTNLYTTGFAPACGSGVDKIALAERLARGVGAECYPALHFDALDEEDPWVPAFIGSLRRLGYVVRVYRHFGNWYEPLDGRTAGDYLHQRGGALRELLRRKRRRLERNGELSFAIVADIASVEPAIAEYERIYALSWKEPEPFPRFHAELMRAAARAGCLRLGFCRIGGQNVAVQLWIKSGGRAAVLKLAHDEGAKQHSAGSLLLAHMITHLVDGEDVQQLDFGRGDDPYKREWASRRRQRVGFVAASPYSPGGFAEAVSSIVPGKIMDAVRSGLGRRREKPNSQDVERAE